MTGEPQRLEDVELRPEADERRHAGGGEHQRHHHEREQRIALVQALEVIEVFGFEALARLASTSTPNEPSVMSTYATV